MTAIDNLHPETDASEATRRMWAAVYANDVAGVREAVRDGADLTLTNRYGGIPIIPAAERAQLEMIEYLLTTDIDVNHVNNLGWTALHEAIILGDGSDRYVQTVRLLLAGGADPSIPDGDGISPHDLAEHRGFSRIAALLRP